MMSDLISHKVGTVNNCNKVAIKSDKYSDTISISTNGWQHVSTEINEEIASMAITALEEYLKEKRKLK